MDKHTVKLIEGFLSAQYERFQVYLESQDIESTEADVIVNELTRRLEQPFKFDHKNQPAKSQTVYRLNGEDNFTSCFEDVIDDLLEDHQKGSVVSITQGDSVPAAHKQFIHAGETIESMQEHAYEAFDDFSGTYLTDIGKPHIDQLQRLLIDWFDRNAKQPNFFNVKNTKEIEVTVGENTPCQN